MTRAEDKAIDAWAIYEYREHPKGLYHTCFVDGYKEGYEQAEKDLAPDFEFPFDVPDNDGFIVFTPMDNQTIRRELKLNKGERVIVSIRKEHEKE